LRAGSPPDIAAEIRPLALEVALHRRSFLMSAAALAAVPLAVSAAGAAEDKANTLYLDLKGGRVVIQLRPDLAPKHVERIKTLAARGFYNGLKFHRVIDGFMAQTGDPKGNGTGGSDLPDLPAEFSAAPFVRGTLGMARSSDPNSANSQFFICFADARFLDKKYTVFGEVVSGMEFVDAIKKGSSAQNGTVVNPDVIVKMSLAQ
jgi:peptidylprolyl isomerase